MVFLLSGGFMKEIGISFEFTGLGKRILKYQVIEFREAVLQK